MEDGLLEDLNEYLLDKSKDLCQSILKEVAIDKVISDEEIIRVTNFVIDFVPAFCLLDKSKLVLILKDIWGV